MKTRMRLNQRGYTYIGVLLLVAVMGFMAANTLRWGQQMQRREAEQALLTQGKVLVEALSSYAQATGPGQRMTPSSVQDLLRDPRFPQSTVRHLRRLPPDPITGSAEWGVVMTDDGRGIIGFHSLSEDRPLLRDFKPPFSDFSDALRYRDWLFTLELADED